MATDNLSIGKTWSKAVDSSVETFTLSSSSSQPWEVALGSSAPAESIFGHRVKDSDLQVTRAIGSGHVYVRCSSGTNILARSQG
jgi:hypothetical protein